MEIWKPIKGYETKYSVSNLGRVKRLAHNIEMKLKAYKQVAHYKEQILKLSVKGKYGYPVVDLGGHNQKLVHRLVAEAFIPNPENHKIVDHINR